MDRRLLEFDLEEFYQRAIYISQFLDAAEKAVRHDGIDGKVTADDLLRRAITASRQLAADMVSLRDKLHGGKK